MQFGDLQCCFQAPWGIPPKTYKAHLFMCLLTGFHGDLPETESNYTFLWRGVSSVRIHLCTHTPLLGISQNPSVYLQIIWGRLPVPNSLFMPTLRKHSSLHASLRTLWHINIVTGPSRGPPPERMGLYSGDFPRAGMRNPVTLTQHLQGPGVAPWSSGVCLQALCEGTRTALVPLDPLSLGPPRALYPAYGPPVLASPRTDVPSHRFLSTPHPALAKPAFRVLLLAQYPIPQNPRTSVRATV